MPPSGRRGSPEGVPERVELETVQQVQALLERAARDALVLDNSPEHRDNINGRSIAN